MDDLEYSGWCLFDDNPTSIINASSSTVYFTNPTKPDSTGIAEIDLDN